MAGLGAVPVKRKANFTDIENRVLLANVQKLSGTLFGKIPFSATVQQKQLAWLKVAKAVNSVSSVSRTLEEVKNRWKKHKQTYRKRSKFASGRRRRVSLTRRLLFFGSRRQEEDN